MLLLVPEFVKGFGAILQSPEIFESGIGTRHNVGSHDIHVAEVLENRQRFCDQIGINYDDVVYHVISYDQAQTFDTTIEVTETDTVKYNNEGIFADALYTETAGIGLFLPVADCIATVIYEIGRAHV